ncbi:MAG: J domain-containing protein [Desulfobacterales bacterium]|nr:J domain-containing protein [Desulfobacterales bacterium]
MKSVTEKIFNDQRLLTRFVRQLSSLPDTPALIQFVAGDEDYLLLCSRVPNASAGDSQVLQQLSEICRKHSFDFQVLKERLTPVGQALGLALSSEQIDYYELLGISSDARKADIKKAFRKRVRKVHPDTSGQMTDSGQDFINLKAAYQILSDPDLRRQYDETLQHVSLWKEKADPIHRLSGSRSLNPLIAQNTNLKQPGRTKIYYQLGGLFLLLIIAVFILDFLYRQNSILDGDYTVKQRQVQKPDAMKEGSERTANSRNRSENTKVKRLPNASNNTRKIYPADDIVEQANQKSNGEVSADGSK